MRGKKRRTYNARIFRSRRAYSFSDIAEMLNTHIRTVQIWRSEGLKILDDGMKPFLVMGQDIRIFLKERVQSRKKPLNTGEFLCPKCQKPRKSCPNQLTAEFTNRRLGPLYKQVLLRGVCESCGQSLLLFSSDRKILEWQKNGLILSEHVTALTSSDSSSTNTDMLKGWENDESKR
jgi:hypothetical protein